MYLHVLGEELGDEVGLHFLLVVDAAHDELGPEHEVSDFLGRRRAVDVPLERLFQLRANQRLQSTTRAPFGN